MCPFIDMNVDGSEIGKAVIFCCSLVDTDCLISKREKECVGLSDRTCFSCTVRFSGTWKDVLWPDNWTAVTQDGKLSAQFEHTLLVTDSGCDILTRRRSNDGRPYFMDQLS